MKLNCDINTNVRFHLTQYVCAGLFCFFCRLDTGYGHLGRGNVNQRIRQACGLVSRSTFLTND